MSTRNASTAPGEDPDGIPWLDPDEQSAWRAFIEMGDEIGLRIERDLQSRSGLSSADYQVLVHLSESVEDRARPVDMCRSLRWEQSRLSHQLTRMARRDLIERRDCDEDGRGSIIVLTPQGRAAIESAAPEHVRALRSLLVEPLGRDGLLQLGNLARKVLEALPDAAAPESGP